MRRRAWHDREVSLEPAGSPVLADPGASPPGDALMAELLAAVRDAIAEELTGHQRAVLVAMTINGAEAAVPGMLAHLEGCPACRQDHESLRALVSADAGR